MIFFFFYVIMINNFNCFILIELDSDLNIRELMMGGFVVHTDICTMTVVMMDNLLKCHLETLD